VLHLHAGGGCSSVSSASGFTLVRNCRPGLHPFRLGLHPRVLCCGAGSHRCGAATVACPASAAGEFCDGLVHDAPIDDAPADGCDDDNDLRGGGGTVVTDEKYNYLAASMADDGLLHVGVDPSMSTNTDADTNAGTTTPMPSLPPPRRCSTRSGWWSGVPPPSFCRRGRADKDEQPRLSSVPLRQ
jgi:hypothetical protein